MVPESVWGFRGIIYLFMDVCQICHLQCADRVSPLKMRGLWYPPILHPHSLIRKAEDEDKFFFLFHRSVISSGRKVFPSSPQQICIYISLVTSRACQNSQTVNHLLQDLRLYYHITKGPSHPPKFFLNELAISPLQQMLSFGLLVGITSELQI